MKKKTNKVGGIKVTKKTADSKKNKFPVGSKVKLKKSTTYRPPASENIGIVTSIDYDVCHVKFPASKNTIAFYDYELESASGGNGWMQEKI